VNWTKGSLIDSFVSVQLFDYAQQGVNACA
jgi:hypothetical protein